MNLIIQRIIRQGLTMASGYLATKGVIAAEQADTWTAGGTEFLTALVVFAVGFAWSTINANLLKRK